MLTQDGARLSLPIAADTDLHVSYDMARCMLDASDASGGWYATRQLLGGSRKGHRVNFKLGIEVPTRVANARVHAPH